MSKNTQQPAEKVWNNAEGQRLFGWDKNLQREVLVYDPHPHQVLFHQTSAPNYLAWGPRGTGKSKMLRMDAVLRCLMFPNFRALILRRTMPELRDSHFNDIEIEMSLLGGVFLKTTSTAVFPNGSTIRFRHCETDADILNFLSAQYGFIGFDELSTFTLDQFLMIGAAARAVDDAPYMAVVRACSNPMGIGAEWMQAWFVNHDVDLEKFPEYHAEDYPCQYNDLSDNPSLDRAAYIRKLGNLPDHVRRAWLNGEFVIEGAYFMDYRPMKDGKPWHVIEEIPTLWNPRTQQHESLLRTEWINIYRAVDWGFHPDPAVCLWIAVLPNHRAIVFREMQWHRTVAADVAKDIVRLSEGLRIAETFCDPSMFISTGTTIYSIGELFEMNGVPLTQAANKRELYGYAVHDWMNTIVDGLPQIQFLRPGNGLGAPNLIKTIPLMQMDKTDPRKMAPGNDHWVVSCAYFCMGSVPASQSPQRSSVPYYLQRSRGL
ncbi:MAG: phage terminase large subunit [Vicinamibacterales bacterium]